MKQLVELSYEEARKHLLKGSSYFNGDMPPYISFEPILADVDAVLGGKSFLYYKSTDPSTLPIVNYSFVANKDGRFAWRPYELMHPAIYVSLLNEICKPDSWHLITQRLKEFEGGAVDCCSAPVISLDNQTDVATQVWSWWQSVEQRCSLQLQVF